MNREKHADWFSPNANELQARPHWQWVHNAAGEQLATNLPAVPDLFVWLSNAWPHTPRVHTNRFLDVLLTELTHYVRCCKRADHSPLKYPHCCRRIVCEWFASSSPKAVWTLQKSLSANLKRMWTVLKTLFCNIVLVSIRRTNLGVSCSRIAVCLKPLPCVLREHKRYLCERKSLKTIN